MPDLSNVRGGCYLVLDDNNDTGALVGTGRVSAIRAGAEDGYSTVEVARVGRFRLSLPAALTLPFAVGDMIAVDVRRRALTELVMTVGGTVRDGKGRLLLSCAVDAPRGWIASVEPASVAAASVPTAASTPASKTPPLADSGPAQSLTSNVRLTHAGRTAILSGAWQRLDAPDGHWLVYAEATAQPPRLDFPSLAVRICVLRAR